MEVSVEVKPLKDDIKDLLGRSIGSLTSDTEVFDKVMGAIWEGMQMSGELPEDSGALKMGDYGPYYSRKSNWTDSKGRVHKRTLYPRHGNTYVTTHARYSTLHIEPFEERPYEDNYYAGRNAGAIEDAKEAALADISVLEQIADIVGDKLRRNING